jgi:hypothetical protein
VDRKLGGSQRKPGARHKTEDPIEIYGSYFKSISVGFTFDKAEGKLR